MSNTVSTPSTGVKCQGNLGTYLISSGERELIPCAQPAKGVRFDKPLCAWHLWKADRQWQMSQSKEEANP